MRFWFGLMLLLTFAPRFAYAAIEQAWTLPQLVSHATASREDIAAQRERIEAAQWQIKQAFSHYLPRLLVSGELVKTYDQLTLDLSDSEVSATASANVELPGLGTMPISAEVGAPLPEDVAFYDDTYADAEVRVEQPLFTWGRIKNNVNAAKQLREHEQAQLRLQQLQVVYDVRDAFYAFVVAQKVLQFTQRKVSELNLVKEIVEIELMTPREDAQTAVTELDLLEVEGYHLRARSAQLEAEHLVRMALELIGLAAGLTSTDLARGIDASSGQVTTDLGPLDRYLDRGLVVNPLLQSLSNGVQAKKYRAKAERAAGYPMLGLGLFYKNLGGVDSSFRPNHHVGGTLTMRMALFDGGESRAKARHELAEANALAYRLDYARKQIQTAVRTAYQQLVNLDEILALDEAEMEVIEQRRKLALFGLRSGASTYGVYRDALEVQVDKAKGYHEKLLERYQAETRLMKSIGVESL